MTRLGLIAILLLLMLAACGGGNESQKPAYTVDLSTPDGAADAWKYAIEWHDLDVAKQLFLASEMEVNAGKFADNIRASQARKITTKVELDKQGKFIDDNTTIVWVTYTESQDGKDLKPDRIPLVIVKDTDGKWKYSRAETEKAKAELAAAQNAPPANKPAPPNGE